MSSRHVFLGLGSNIEPERCIPAALRLLRERMTLTAFSTVYLNPAEGQSEQPAFYNLVAQVETGLPQAELKQALREIESICGRVRHADIYAPRTIDLDILYIREPMGEVVFDPAIASRPFVAVPLAELAPDLLLPTDGQPIATIAAALTRHDMTALPAFTEALKGELLDEHPTGG